MAKRSNRKRPGRSVSPNPQKTPHGKTPSLQKVPHVGAPISNHSETPTWRLAYTEVTGPFGWHDLARKDALEILQKLKNFESMTWSEILVDSKKQNHTIPIPELSKEAQSRLREIGNDDIDTLISLRLSGKRRVWGIRTGSTLSILWWDPEHRVCPSKKKHT